MQRRVSLCGLLGKSRLPGRTDVSIRSMPEAAKENQNWLKGNPQNSKKSQKSQEITRNPRLCSKYPYRIQKKSTDNQNWLKGNPKMCFFEKSIRIFCHFYQYKIDSQHITMFGSSNQVSKENKNCKDKKICSIYIFIYMFLHSIELSQMVYDRLLLIKVE